jgi:hypothetical protein
MHCVIRCGSKASTDVGNGFGNTICDPPGRAKHVCFPDADYRPTSSFERPLVFVIPRHVALYLRDPVCRVVALAKLCETPRQIAAMPEVTIAEDHDPLSGEHDIRTAGQASNVKAITKAPAPEFSA